MSTETAPILLPAIALVAFFASVDVGGYEPDGSVRPSRFDWRRFAWAVAIGFVAVAACIMTGELG